ncbi:hypothetical protein AB4Z21_05570, partial [Paenibacillus sp. MCAF20]
GHGRSASSYFLSCSSHLPAAKWNNNVNGASAFRNVSYNTPEKEAERVCQSKRILMSDYWKP